MEKIINFRDLGGIPLENGKKVKTGVFFRSSELDFATQNDINELRSLGIKAIFDFRDDSEKVNLDVYRKINIKYINIPVRAENDTILKLRTKPKLSTLLSLRYDDMCEVYSKLPFNNKSYQEFFKLVKEEELPILFHCTAGKDRTGVISALILTLLGASRSEIIKDYLKTQSSVPLLMKEKLKYFFFPIRGFMGKKLYPLFAARTEYIESALEALQSKFKNIEDYFLSEYNYTQNDIEKLKKYATE